MPVPVGEPPAAPPTEAAAPRYRLLPWLTGAGFLILAAALAWVWRYPFVAPQSADQTDAMVRQLGALEARVARLEQRPPPQAADLGPLTARVTALEQRPIPQGTASAPAAPDLAPLEARVSALQQRQSANLAPLEARIAALESRQPADNQLATRITALEGAEGSMQAQTSRPATRLLATWRLCRRPDWHWRSGRSSAMYRAPHRHWHGSPTPARLLRPRCAWRSRRPRAKPWLPRIRSPRASRC